jgi:2-hydroxy-3-oxopropionate reductase
VEIKMEHVGFIGLGIMGKPMALHLLQSGYSLAVLNRSPGPQTELVTAGAIAGTSPKHVAEQSDVVITMLPDSPDVERVVLGKDGVLEGMQSGGLFIDMSTVLPSLAQRIAHCAEQKGCASLDAPVSGGQVGAQNATLSIMVGGESAAFERAKPILEKMGKNIVHVGKAGAGQVTKAANQLVVGVTIAAISEALVLAAKASVDPAKVREALLGGFAQSRILDLHGSRILQRNFQPGFKTKLHRKDLAIVLDTARDLGLALPVSATVAELMNGLIANGGGELDHSALVTVLEKLGNVQTKAPLS